MSSIPDPATTDWVPLAGVGGLPTDAVVSAATRIIANKLLAGDANNAWRVLGDGRMDWGAGGTTALDTNLYRSAAGLLKTDGDFSAVGILRAGTGTAWEVSLGWGGLPGAGAGILFGSAGDTNLYRSAAGVLRTDGAFYTGGPVYSGIGQPYQMGLTTVGGNPGLTFGNAGDTSLYRSAAGVLKTPGQFQGGTFIFGAPSEISGDTGVAWNKATLYFTDTNATNAYSWSIGAGPGKTFSIGDQIAGLGRYTIDSLGNHFFSGSLQLNSPGSLYMAGEVSFSPRAGGAVAWFTMVTGDSAMRVRADADGSLRWGDGNVSGSGWSGDVVLYRSGAGQLMTTAQIVSVNTNGGFRFLPATAGGLALSSNVQGDAQPRFYIDFQGFHRWGDGVAALDTTLYRAGATLLKTDGGFWATYFATSYGTADSVVIGDVSDWIGAPADRPGFLFGAANDTNLYRIAADMLRTDDAFQVGAGLYIYGDVSVDSGGTGKKIYFGSAFDTTLERPSAGVLKTNGQIEVGATGIKFSNGSVQTVAAAGTLVLIQEIILGANGVIDFTGIPSTYRHLRLEGSVRGSDTGQKSDYVRCRFNNDSGSTSYMWWGQGQNAPNNEYAAQMELARITGGATSMDSVGFGGKFTVDIPYYAAANGCPGALARFVARIDNAGTVGDAAAGTASGTWVASNAAVNRITLFTSFGSGNFKSGSRVALYGVV